MATTYTPNLNLGKQENKYDKFSMAVITESMNKLDAIASEIDSPIWQNGMLNSTTHEVEDSTKQCITKFIPASDGEIYVGCAEGYQVQVVWYNDFVYDTLAAYRYTPMRAWGRNGANYCRIMVRKSPATDITPEEAYANVTILSHNEIEHNTTWASGSINSNTGAEASQNKRIRSGYIPIGNGIKITIPDGGKILPIIFKDKTPTVEYSVAFQTQSFTIYPQTDTCE